jgi:hypothetical protein
VTEVRLSSYMVGKEEFSHRVSTESQELGPCYLQLIMVLSLVVVVLGTGTSSWWLGIHSSALESLTAALLEKKPILDLNSKDCL